MRLHRLGLLACLSMPWWAVAPATAADGRPALAGHWEGEVAAFSLALHIQPDGRFRWTAVRGNARAEGEGRLEAGAGGWRLGLPFVQAGSVQVVRERAPPALLLRDDAGRAWPLRPAP